MKNLAILCATIALVGCEDNSIQALKLPTAESSTEYRAEFNKRVREELSVNDAGYVHTLLRRLPILQGATIQDAITAEKGYEVYEASLEPLANKDLDDFTIEDRKAMEKYDTLLNISNHLRQAEDVLAQTKAELLSSTDDVFNQKLSEHLGLTSKFSHQKRSYCPGGRCTAFDMYYTISIKEGSSWYLPPLYGLMLEITDKNDPTYKETHIVGGMGFTQTGPKTFELTNKFYTQPWSFRKSEDHIKPKELEIKVVGALTQTGEKITVANMTQYINRIENRIRPMIQAVWNPESISYDELAEKAPLHFSKKWDIIKEIDLSPQDTKH